MKELHKHQSLPLYLQVAQDLMHPIESGAYPAGHRLPSDNQLVFNLYQSNTR
ncbi:hypothetical protein [Vibrio sp. RE86]|uniref:hypothetical protein n=1 Tax=Vibrio sp. RE86 TaxID=2607605 RepID=UPI00149358ED|nr:hypothetical protein [Vibrio sp. RE86]